MKTDSIYKYKYLTIIYLYSFTSYSIANYTNTDVQLLYRIPGLNIRWIDSAIFIFIVSFFLNINSQIKRLKTTNILVALSFLYLIFETIQLIRSWGLNEKTSQLSHFFCTLSFFILINLSVYKISIPKILNLLNKITIWAAFVVIITNLYLLYSFVSGKTIYTDSDIRIGIDVIGRKENIYDTVLVTLVYAFGLYFIQNKFKLWKKLIFILSILTIYGSQVILFERGKLAALLIITFYYLISRNKGKQLIIRLTVIVVLICTCYFIFGKMLANKGYDPLTRIMQTATYATDIKNPDWDKGRSISQGIAIKAWEKNIWFGAGYDELFHYGLPEEVATAHNGIITSLFHRGIVGTTLLLLIFFMTYKNAIKLWRISMLKKTYEYDLYKLLILVAFLWLIPFMTQEALWEKYSFCIQLMYLGIITNIYAQQFAFTKSISLKNKEVSYQI